MRQIITNPRDWALIALLTAALIALLALPAEGTSIAKWLLTLALSKAAGLALLATATALHRRWNSRGKTGSLSRWLEKGN